MKPKHQPCPCGCGEMADECMNPRMPYPFSAFTITFTGSSKATICERCGETDPVMMNEGPCDACLSHEGQWKKQPPMI